MKAIEDEGVRDRLGSGEHEDGESNLQNEQTGAEESTSNQSCHRRESLAKV